MDKYFCYKDITLIPRFSDLHSRSLADTSQTFGNGVYSLPIVPSNMKCTIDDNLARWLSANSYFYIMHRFDNDIIRFVANAQKWETVSISIGVKQEDYDIIEEITANNYRVDYITIDVAHGHHQSVKNIIEFISDKLDRDRTYVIAGNIATVEAARSLRAWGADAVKVGIGQGAACTTKDKTGFTLPMFTCIQNIFEKVDIDIIADGGIRCNGDIAKALVAGADMVMIGSMFAQCIDSPGLTIRTDSGIKKEYYGSASFKNKGHTNNIEGIALELDCNGMTYEEKLKEIQQDLQSAISYAGKNCLDNNELTDTPWALIRR